MEIPKLMKNNWIVQFAEGENASDLRAVLGRYMSIQIDIDIDVVKDKQAFIFTYI